ncbi:mitochondrial carrier [Choiromyces venosus 120613-1]|uniref:Mitochondrial carrier n=1 Tax=Choiromyces venosus 120613-1 TaxID=1336337 RepID=A0A3N4JVI5_9PEZI|nr:mitochondrial carrier [Choiromyces venosus 120613-1]
MTRVVGTEGGDPASAKRVVIAGAFAGLVSRFVIAPLDVIKIRLQLQPIPTFTPTLPTTASSTLTAVPPPPPLYRGILPTLIRILREETITGLWKGNIPAELLYITYGAAQFLTYRHLTTALDSSAFPFHNTLHPSLKYFISGGLAGAAATTVSYPFDLLRTRFAAQANGDRRIYTSILHSIGQIRHSEGYAGFFRGWGAGVTQIVPYMGLVFTTHEATKKFLGDKLDSESKILDAVSGGLAGVVAKTGTFPLDLIRKRLQVQGPTRTRYILGDRLPIYSGIWRTAADVIRAEGPRGLYRGLAVSLVKAAPLSAAFFLFPIYFTFLDLYNTREGYDTLTLFHSIIKNIHDIIIII